LRPFFKAEQVEFVYAMCAVLFWLIGSFPSFDLQDGGKVVRRFMLSLLLVTVHLDAEIIAGTLSFVFAGLFMYLEQWSV
jgi:hypothetical protein